MSVRTGMYHLEVSRTAMYRVRYVLVRTSTYRHVLPCTRCTGFQMCAVLNHVLGRQRLDSTAACTLFLLLLSTVHSRDYINETHTRFLNERTDEFLPRQR
jgi:hypothetical protein